MTAHAPGERGPIYTPNRPPAAEGPERQLADRKRNIRDVISAGVFDGDAAVVLRDSLKEYRKEGDAIIEKRFLRERQDVGRVSVNIAIAVERGLIGREPALAAVRGLAGSLSPRQLEELLICFPARKPTEELQAFDERRKAVYERRRVIDGLTEAKTHAAKEKMRSILEAAYQLEQGAIQSAGDWPMRTDGQPRRSFIDRTRLMDIAQNVARYSEQLGTDREGTLRELANPTAPRKISEHTDLLRFVERAKGGVEAVTYDMFDTLVQFTSNANERNALMNTAAVKYVNEHGLSIDSEAFRKVRDTVLAEHRAIREKTQKEYRQVDALTMVLQRVAAQLRVKLSSKDAARMGRELEEVYCRVEGDTAVVMPGIKSTLEQLKKDGKKLAVISNFSYSGTSVENLLKRFGLRSYFDVVVVSSECGVVKSPQDKEGKIFREACRLMKVAPEKIVHVGDNKANDQKAPERIGIRGVVFERPTSLLRLEQFQKMDPRAPGYAETALSANNEYLEAGASEYFDRVRKERTPDALKPYALRLYELSRDQYGPLVIKFAEHTLSKLLESPKGTINLCLGRDALAVFLVQKQLLHMFPERYPGITSDLIRYMPVSRKSAVDSDVELVKEQLRDLGVEDATKVILIDNGIGGTIQNRFAEIYPDKEFVGEYLFSRKFTDDPYRDQKHGYIMEEDVTKKVNPDGTPRLRPNRKGIPTEIWTRVGVRSEVDRKVALSLFSGDAVHGHEDIWNGIFASAEPLVRHENGKVRPRNWREGRMVKHGYVEGRTDALPGMEYLENYEIMKRLALKGIMDSLRVYRRQDQLHRTPGKLAVITSMAQWFNAHTKADSVDRRILDGMVRSR